MNVPYCLRRAARFHGKNIAFHHGDEKVTHGEFAKRVELLRGS